MRTTSTTYLPGLKILLDGRRINYVADQIGMDQTWLSQLVSCKRGASLATALRIAKHFGVSVESLVEENNLVVS